MSRFLTPLLVSLFISTALAHDPIDESKSAAEMAAAGMNFFSALSPDQQQRARFDFTSDERLNWAFVPKARKGLPFKDMTPPQREAAIALAKASLSQRAYDKADAIMHRLEVVLHDQENNPNRDPDNYFVTLFGEPKVNGTWGWRLEGHHVAFNFTIVEGKTIAGAPNFLGANPANVIIDGKPLRVLGEAEDLGRSLVTSLTDDQQKIAVIASEAPREITTSNSRKITPGTPAGLSAEKMSAEQKKKLREVIEEYANRLRPELAQADLQKIDDAGADKIYFAWAGALKAGQGHYYRIQGPTFMIEYDNTQNNANHIHAVWRDPANDFGEDLLKNHYESSKHDHE